MESERQVIKNLLVIAAIVFGHGLEEGFLIANQEVIGEVIVDFHLGPDFTKWMFGYAHEFVAWFEVFFGIAFSLHIL